MPRDPPRQQGQGLQSPCLGTSRSATGCHGWWRQNGDGKGTRAAVGPAGGQKRLSNPWHQGHHCYLLFRASQP